MEMGTSSSSGLVKAKSETLAEALKSSSLDFSNGGGSSHGSKEDVMARTLSSPSHGSSSSNNRRNTHIRKAKSAHPALDLGRLTGGAALSRASSASLGLSFSFTGFTVPHEEIIASERCSNDDICKKTIKTQHQIEVLDVNFGVYWVLVLTILLVAVEDIEAATSSVVKFQEEPTFPIYLKVTHFRG